jgi:hypothetical protein
MNTKTRTRTRKFTPHVEIEAGLVWVDDQPTWQDSMAWHYAPTQETTPAPTQDETTPEVDDLAAEMFTQSGAQLRKLAYTPTGRTRTTAEAQAALGEIARRAANKAARKAAR